MTQQATILVAESNSIDREHITALLEAKGYEVVQASDGPQALSRLKNTPRQFATVILQRRLEGMDTRVLLGKLKSHAILKVVPVIIHAENEDEQDMLEELRAGAQYYLTKPLKEEVLLAMVDTAVADHSQYRSLQLESKNCDGKLLTLQSGHFRFRTLDEASYIGTLLASAFPDSDLVVVGLTELLINAVEHGNLEIGYALKSELLTKGTWRDEIERRLQMPPYNDRYVDVTLKKLSGEIRLHIKDDGAGFDWRSYLEIRPERIYDSHGRGIAISKDLSFDVVEYLGKGNEVKTVNYYPDSNTIEF